MENIIERRLRPVFDNLELGNHKKAIQEADKVLKKTPNVQCARALKALALLRLGRDDEAAKLEKELCEEKPCDISTLQVLTFYYRETDELSKICSLYNSAVSVCPGNEELMSHLFMSYVRINDYKQQQTAAMQLYKFRPKNPYYFWAVMSIVLQAQRGPDAKDKAKSKLLLSLAQRMVDKLIQSEKLEAEQEVELYLSILKYQEKYEEALEFYDGPVCKKLFAGAPISIKIELLRNLKRYNDLLELLKKFLTDENDRWDYYKELIGTYLALEDEKPAENDKENKKYIEECTEFIKDIIEKNAKVRGPRLAQLELHRLLREKGLGTKANDLLGDYTELMIQYYVSFGDRICCTSDLKLFLEYMDADKRPGYAAKLLQECGISSTTLPESKEQMQKHICALQISRICGAHAALSTDHLSALFTALSLHYEHGVSAFGQNLLSTDIGPSDPYALLAANVMYDISVRTQCSDRLVEALCLLNYLLSNSPSNFHAKLLCLQIYHILGCGTGAQNILQSLDVKHIQLDSMGYLHSAQLPIEGIPSIAHQVYETTVKFFQSSQKDTLEYLAMSYKYGSFSKLEEFMNFRERLSNSFHSALNLVELQLLEIISCAGNAKQNITALKNLSIKHDEDKIAWDKLSDNRDLAVMVRWDPAFPYVDEEGKVVEPDAMKDKIKKTESESFVQDLELLQIRSSIVRTIAAMVELIIQPTTAENPDLPQEKVQYNFKILKILKTHWEDIFKRLDKVNYQPTSQKYLVNLIPSRLHLLLNLPYQEFINILIDFVMNLWSGSKIDAEKSQNALATLVTFIGDMLKNQIMDHNESSDLFWNRRTIQANIVGCVEILSLCTFVVSIYHDRLSGGNQQVQTKKGKKKDGKQTNQNGVVSETISDAEKANILTNLLRVLKSSLIECEKALDTWKTPTMTTSLVKFLSAMSLDPNTDLVINNTFKENHATVVKDLKQLLKDKIKMANK